MHHCMGCHRLRSQFELVDVARVCIIDIVARERGACSKLLVRVPFKGQRHRFGAFS